MASVKNLGKKILMWNYDMLYFTVPFSFNEKLLTKQGVLVYSNSVSFQIQIQFTKYKYIFVYHKLNDQWWNCIYSPASLIVEYIFK